MLGNLYLLTIIIYIVVTHCCLAQTTKGTSSEQKSKDLDSYTKEELLLLPKFRARIKDGLTLQYMFQDKYLIRFLRASNLNLNDGERMMRENFQWRKKYNVDNLIFEFQSPNKFSRRFPFYFSSARDQRPTIVGALKDVNVRHLALTGELPQMRRYLIYAIERAVWNVHLGANRTGLEIVGGILLFNMAGFNLRNQACAFCIPLWIELVESYERYYPQLGHKILVINTPRIFQSLFVLIKPLATGHTLNALSLYGLDKSEWQPELFKIYEKEKLTLEFGGTAPPQKLYTLTPELLAIQLGPTLNMQQNITA